MKYPLRSPALKGVVTIGEWLLAGGAGIGNRESGIGNRESGIGNRKSRSQDTLVSQRVTVCLHS
ncbi:hypothetical protein EYC56_07890 [Xanthomonas oryzae]|nr:hypothetical protein EYC56_07890 [Xanthomonas oryzae]